MTAPTNTDSFGVPLHSPRREKARRKLLRLLDRKMLEDLSGRDRPWHSDRPTLESAILARWPHDDIAEAIGQLVEAAR